MSEPIAAEVMNVAASIEKDIPSRITGENRVFIRAVIARAIMVAKAEEREECAKIADQAAAEASASQEAAFSRGNDVAGNMYWSSHTAALTLAADIRSRSHPTQP